MDFGHDWSRKKMGPWERGGTTGESALRCRLETVTGGETKSKQSLRREE